MRFEFVLVLGVKDRLMLFYKYGSLSRVLRVRAFLYVLVGISSFLLLVRNLLSWVVFPMRRRYAKLWALHVLITTFLTAVLRFGFYKKQGILYRLGGLPTFREGSCCIVSGFCASIT
jgi:hypothetical protein